MRINLKRVNDRVHFVAANDEGNELHIDGSPAIGGTGAGFRPMQLVLAAIAGCSVMDVVEILTKQRQRLDDVEIVVDGERIENAGSAPFRTVKLHFILSGEIDETKAARAVALAVEKYCSVGEMLKATVGITHSFEIRRGSAPHV